MSYVWFLVIVLNEGSVHAFPNSTETQCLTAIQDFKSADESLKLTKSISCVETSDEVFSTSRKEADSKGSQDITTTKTAMKYHYF
jgi:hypothetical protein